MNRRFPISALALASALFALTIVLTPPARSRAEDASPTAIRKTVDIESSGRLGILVPEGVYEFESGYEIVDDLDGVALCDAGLEGWHGGGIRYYYQLNQEQPAPIIATGWSRAKGVDGNKDGAYSLYLDIEYADGTMLWGQTFPFPVGDSDWNFGKVVVFPEKPIKSLSFYGLFRNHSGRAYFKDLQLAQYMSPSDLVLFDRVPVVWRSVDPNASRVMLRDYGKNGDFAEFSLANRSDGFEYDGIRVQPSAVRTPGLCEEYAFELTSTTDEDRALTFVYSLPFALMEEEGDQWYWDDDANTSRPIDQNELSNATDFAAIGAGPVSKYPLGTVSLRDATGAVKKAFGLAVDPDYPAFFRIAANGATRELFVAFDVALTPERPTVELRVLPLFWRLADDGTGVVPQGRYTGSATYFDKIDAFNKVPTGSTPFRAGFDLYRRAFPESFKVRAPQQGLWMAFSKVSNVPDWQDFGFQFKEGIDEPGKDDEKGLTTFRYTEPMTWWQSAPDVVGSQDAIKTALERVKELATQSESNRDARALLTTGFRDKEGQYSGRSLDTPWCAGMVWSMNDAPGLVALIDEDESSASEDGFKPFASFATKWSEQIADDLYGAVANAPKIPTTREEAIEAQTRPGCDGEYVDSSEGYVTAELDFARNHFAAMTTPLTFDRESGTPAIFRGLIAYEYVRKISEDVHARGKLSMANATPDQLFWLTPQLDVVGTETNWRWGGPWNPMPIADLLYRRTISCGKPFCFLMNTDFSKFSHEDTERYMKRALAFGMFPGFFSANASTDCYFENPALFERDRDLFKRYIPLCKRVAESGWEPETLASSNAPEILVERFGALPDASVETNPMRPSSAVYLTIFNDSQESRDYEIALAPGLRQFVESAATVRELTTGADLAPTDGVLKGALDAQDVRVIEIVP